MKLHLELGSNTRTPRNPRPAHGRRWPEPGDPFPNHTRAYAPGAILGLSATRSAAMPSQCYMSGFLTSFGRSRLLRYGPTPNLKEVARPYIEAFSTALTLDQAIAAVLDEQPDAPVAETLTQVLLRYRESLHPADVHRLKELTFAHRYGSSRAQAAQTISELHERSKPGSPQSPAELADPELILPTRRRQPALALERFPNTMTAESIIRAVRERVRNDRGWETAMANVGQGIDNWIANEPD